MPDERNEWDLVFAFPDQSPAYARGFTGGRIWQRLSTETAPFEETILADYREDMIAMATARGWSEEFTALDLDDVWFTVKFTPEKRS